jgi:hypothetical protein
MNKIAILILIAASCCACHQPGKVVNKTSKIHMVDSTMDAIQDTQYVAYVEPIKAELEAQLNETIG